MQFNDTTLSFVKGITSIPSHSDDINLSIGTDEKIRYVNSSGEVKVVATEDTIVGGGINQGKYVEIIGDNVTNPIIITHNLNTKDVLYTLRENITNELVQTDFSMPSVDTAKLTFSTIPTSGQYTVTIVGDLVVGIRSYTETIGDNITNPIIITHNLGTQDLITSVRDLGNNELIEVETIATDTNTCILTFTTTPTINQYRITIIGVM